MTMPDDEITYAKVRAVREETGASHDECQRVLEAVGGDVKRASALWFSERRPARESPAGARNGAPQPGQGLR
jgi:hypothetical protein